jgi:carboxyl-terminal processing protease
MAFSPRHLSDEAAALMRGQQGTTVTLKCCNEEMRELSRCQVSLTRDVITLNPVFAELRHHNRWTSPWAICGSASLMATPRRIWPLPFDPAYPGRAPTGFMLDLRNNPGGLLQAGIEIARLWLSQGTIVYTVNRQGMLDSFESFGPAITDAPLVVLVNEGTASASEILAGALQDNGRAKLVGSVTFGKGLIQSLFDLSDGSGLAVTVAKYETPNHHDINNWALPPIA